MATTVNSISGGANVTIDGVEYDEDLSLNYAGVIPVNVPYIRDLIETGDTSTLRYVIYNDHLYAFTTLFVVAGNPPSQYYKALMYDVSLDGSNNVKAETVPVPFYQNQQRVLRSAFVYNDKLFLIFYIGDTSQNSKYYYHICYFDGNVWTTVINYDSSDSPFYSLGSISYAGILFDKLIIVCNHRSYLYDIELNTVTQVSEDDVLSATKYNGKLYKFNDTYFYVYNDIFERATVYYSGDAKSYIGGYYYVRDGYMALDENHIAVRVREKSNDRYYYSVIDLISGACSYFNSFFNGKVYDFLFTSDAQFPETFPLPLIRRALYITSSPNKLTLKLNGVNFDTGSYGPYGVYDTPFLSAISYNKRQFIDRTSYAKVNGTAFYKMLPMVDKNRIVLCCSGSVFGFYNTVEHVITRMSDSPISPSCIAIYANTLYITSTSTGSVYKYDDINGVWTLILTDSRIVSSYGHKIYVVNDSFYILARSSNSNTASLYRLDGDSLTLIGSDYNNLMTYKTAVDDNGRVYYFTTSYSGYSTSSYSYSYQHFLKVYETDDIENNQWELINEIILDPSIFSKSSYDFEEVFYIDDDIIVFKDRPYHNSDTQRYDLCIIDRNSYRDYFTRFKNDQTPCQIPNRYFRMIMDNEWCSSSFMVTVDDHHVYLGTGAGITELDRDHMFNSAFDSKDFFNYPDYEKGILESSAAKIYAT